MADIPHENSSRIIAAVCLWLTHYSLNAQSATVVYNLSTRIVGDGQDGKVFASMYLILRRTFAHNIYIPPVPKRGS